MPWHKIQDELEETRLAKTGAAFGSTKRGIAYAYSDKYRKKTLRLGDLLHLKEESVQNRLKMMLEAKNLELAGCYYQEPMSYPALLSWCEAQAAELWPYIVDTGAYLEEALKEGKRVVLEAQLGAIRYLCTDSLRTSLYCIDVAAFNLGSLWFVGMNLGFLLGVNDHWLVIHFLYLQCSHLLSLKMQNSHPASRMAML